MSRTDKDRPYAVLVRDPHLPTVEDHVHFPPQFRFSRRGNYEGTCTLDAFDHEVDLIKTPKLRACERHLPRWAAGGWQYTEPRHGTHNPERTRTRNTLRDAVKDFNANGELDGFDYWTTPQCRMYD